MYTRKRTKKTSERTICATPKIADLSAFDNDGQYPPVVVISRYSNHGFLALAM
jgi:hypothetical protein